MLSRHNEHKTKNRSIVTTGWEPKFILSSNKKKERKNKPLDLFLAEYVTSYYFGNPILRWLYN